MSRKENILKTAIKLFSTNGYDGTSTKLIATTAGVSEGLLFRHFSNKEGLLKAIVEEGMAQVAASLEPLGHLKPGDNAISLHLKLTEESLRKNTSLWQLIHALRLNTKVRMQVLGDIEKSNGFIINLLSGYFKQMGYKQPDTEARLYFATVDGIALQYIENPEEYPLTQIMNVLKKRYQ